MLDQRAAHSRYSPCDDFHSVISQCEHAGHSVVGSETVAYWHIGIKPAVPHRPRRLHGTHGFAGKYPVYKKKQFCLHYAAPTTTVIAVAYCDRHKPCDIRYRPPSSGSLLECRASWTPHPSCYRLPTRCQCPHRRYACTAHRSPQLSTPGLAAPDSSVAPGANAGCLPTLRKHTPTGRGPSCPRHYWSRTPNCW